MTRALCGIPSYPRHVTSACNVAAYLESDSFGCALRSPFSEISHAAIPPSAALCSEREVTYLLSLNGFIFIFTCLISYFGIKVNLFIIFRIFQVTIRYYSRLMCAGADAFRPLWARRRLNLSAIRLRSEKQRYEAEEKPPLTQ